jgi:inosine-uridine nucleoside N-ribohydrolase
VTIPLAASSLAIAGTATVYGNAPVDMTTSNALRLLDLADPEIQMFR